MEELKNNLKTQDTNGSFIKKDRKISKVSFVDKPFSKSNIDFDKVKEITKKLFD